PGGRVPRPLSETAPSAEPNCPSTTPVPTAGNTPWVIRGGDRRQSRNTSRSSARYGTPGSRSRMNADQYRTAPITPPATGPTQYTHQSFQVPETRAGPNERTGLTAPPVNGPATRMSEASTDPTVRPAACGNGPRSSRRGGEQVDTKKKARTASIRMPLPWVVRVDSG